MPADLPPVDVSEVVEIPAVSIVASAHVPVAYGTELDADIGLHLDLAAETALALGSDADLTR